MKPLLSFLFLLLFLVGPVNGQFGRNKIRERDFQWKTWETIHFIIHYYEETAHIIPEIERILEKTHDEYRDRMEIELKNKVPVIVYYHSKDFSQTNITDAPLSEGVGGFTELSKRRLVLPYNGDIYDFKRILQHELVHVFQYEYIVPSDMPLSSLYYNLAFPPLWVMEGMAEYFSDDWQPEGRMMLRENILSGELLEIPLLSNETFHYYGYYAYKLAQSFTEFLCQRYGEKKFVRYFKSLSRKISIRPEEAFEAQYGMSMKRAVELWHHELKQFYWQDGLEKKNPYDVYHLTEIKNSFGGGEGRILLYAPKLSPAGDVMAVYSNIGGEGNIVLAGAENGRFIMNVTQGYADRLYDYLQIRPANLHWSRDGEKLYFAARKVNSDVLVEKNIITGKVRIVKIPELAVIHGLTQCSDSGALLLLGQKRNSNVIVFYQPSTGHSRILDSSFYYRKSITATELGKAAFVQRDAYGDSIYEYDLKKGTKKVLYQTENINSMAYYDGCLYFDRNFSHALYLCKLDLESGAVYQITETLNSTINPDVSAEKIIFNIYKNDRYEVALLDRDDTTETLLVEMDIPESFEPVMISEEDTAAVIEGGKPYRPKLKADFVTGQMEYFSSGYFRTYATLTGMDIMGDYRFQVHLDMTRIESFDDINGQIAFNYLKKRYSLGVFFYLWKDYYFSDFSLLYDYSEHYIGGAASVSYPLSQKDRVEGAVHVYRKTLKFMHIPITNSAMAYTTQLAYVRDSSRSWGYYHPLSGYRFRFSYEQSYPLGESLNYGMALGDFRSYLRISRRISLAQRVIYGESWGGNALPFKMGGINTLRGYDYQDLQGEKILLYNGELRFPLVDYILLAIPGFGLPEIRGLLFYDMAYVGPRDGDIRLFTKNEEGEKAFGPDVYGSYGLGLRYNFSGLLNLKFDWAWKTHLDTKLNDKAVFQFGISSDF
ncbi:MAG TPA: hypothetical protein ENN72_07835 [Firmicutes bacterium]|nr:hypothetical protein [Bacillota bacterium]